MPRNICWKIWLARNHLIFEGSSANYTREVFKAINLIAKSRETKGIKYPNIEPLSRSEAR